MVYYVTPTLIHTYLIHNSVRRTRVPVLVTLREIVVFIYRSLRSRGKLGIEVLCGGPGRGKEL